MQADKYRKRLWFFLFSVLCIPLAQHCLSFIKSPKLQGDYDVAEDVAFTKEGWLEGSYQVQKDKYLNDYMGLRPDFVRAGIFIDFIFFKKAKGKYVGKDNYLYYHNYIDAYRGKDFMGYVTVLSAVQKMKYLQDEMEKEHKTFLFMIAPSKVDFYPEYLPDGLNHTKVGPTNTDVYSKYCDSLNVNFINFNDYMLALKKNARGPIFSRQGIHWTRYGAVFAVDSIIRFIEKDRNIDLANPEYSQLERTTIPRGKDNDMGVSLNLPIPIKEDFVYPVIQMQRTATTTTTSALYIGDSFFWLLQDDSITHTNHQYEYWYYFKDVFTGEENGEGQPVAQISSYNWKAKVDNMECVIMLFTPRNLNEANRFIDSLYSYYKEKKESAQSK